MENTENVERVLKTRVLIVSPDLAFNNHLVSNLEANKQLSLSTSFQIDEAIEQLKTSPFDVIITNDDLQSIHVLDFAQKVRKDFIFKPEIIVLSDEQQINLRSCHQVGISYLVRKPVNIEQLNSAIERVADIERRKFDRVNVNSAMLGNLFGKVSMKGKKQEASIEVSNLGRGGFFYKVNHRNLPEIGQIINFDLTLGMVPNTHFKGKGIIRWVKKEGAESGAGVEFLSIPEESEKLVQAYVELFKVLAFVPEE